MLESDKEYLGLYTAALKENNKILDQTCAMLRKQFPFLYHRYYIREFNCWNEVRKQFAMMHFNSGCAIMVETLEGHRYVLKIKKEWLDRFRNAITLNPNPDKYLHQQILGRTIK